MVPEASCSSSAAAAAAHAATAAGGGGGELVLPPQVAESASPEPHGAVGHPHVFVLVLLGLLPLFAQSVVVLDELDHVGDLVADVDALVLAWVRGNGGMSILQSVLS